MTGYYNIGLCGYKVWINDEDVRDEKIHFTFIGTATPDKVHRVKLYYSERKGSYFITPYRRIHLDDCLRVGM